MAKASGRRILLIDDDADLRFLYQRQFGQAGLAVDAVATGKEGIEAATTRDYDLILLDILLPDKSGFTVLETLKQTPKTGQTPVLLLTNSGAEESLAQAIQRGAVGYLIKAHMTPEQVVDKVKEILESSGTVKTA